MNLGKRLHKTVSMVGAIKLYMEEILISLLNKRNRPVSQQEKAILKALNSFGVNLFLLEK